MADAPVDFRVLFEKSGGNYLLLDPDLGIVAASDGYCRVSHARRSDLIGRNLLAILTTDDSRPDAESAVQLRLSLARVLRLHRADTLPVLRYDIPRPASPNKLEEKYWVTSSVPILDDEGVLLWVLYRVRDVTNAVLQPKNDRARHQLERSQERLIQGLRRASEELAQMDSLRTAMIRMSRLNTIAMMASALAHDVSQPLTAARNYLSALRRGHDSAPERNEELFTKLGQQIDRAGEIVKGLRSFMAAGTTVHRPESVASVVIEAAKLAESAVRAAGAVLTTHVSGNLPLVAMDRVQIQQLILNLVSNAAEAMRASPRRAIEVAASVAGHDLRVEVSDTGPGLPGDVAQRLDEPFATTKFIGMGLGLPLCRQIVKEHQGTLSVAPNTPVGTIIAFTIPLGGTPAG